jgi:hypothetical protein
MDLFWRYGLPAILGFIAGALGSLVAPWVHWGIEKRRERLKEKRRHVEAWRSVLSDGHITHVFAFRNSAAYSSLRPHLPPEMAEKIAGLQHAGMIGDLCPKILDEVARLEREWKLV